ncbi:cation-transporting P-type ATPase [Candidatus Woesearchaeota archaeon]|nr:cation-transporting P-type ATPase [Candidatus Woesearchaeota archaeon]
MQAESLVGKPVDNWFVQLESSEAGLTEEQVRSKLAKYGSNELHVHKSKNPVILLLKEFMELFPLLLLGAAVLSFFADAKSPGEGYNLIAYALLGVVVLNALVSFIQKFKTERIMMSFLEYIPEKTTVERNGQKMVIDAKDIVPGDIVFFAVGDKLPSDLIILKSSEVLADESILTGESEPVSKIEFANVNHEAIKSGILYSGSSILKGDGKGIVINTGKRTAFGRIQHLAEGVKEELTPIRLQLKDFVKKITFLALAIGIVFFVIGFFLENSFWTNLIFAIGIIVANVPEGLLPTVTLALTQASQKMARRNAIVKDILSVETLGSTTVICTDKTGTLTQNKLTVRKAFLNMKEHSTDDIPGLQNNAASRPFLEVCRLCTSANSVLDKGTYKYVGDPTEVAILEFANKVGNIDHHSFTGLKEKAFSSSDKYMSICYRTEGGTRYTLFKGATEVILNMCSQIHLNGDVVNLDAETRKRLTTVHEGYENNGLRVLGLAYLSTDDEGEVWETEQKHNLVFVGFIGMIDPPRPEVKEAVDKCKRAGIKIIVISGDKAETVTAIAKELDIVDKPVVVSGKELKEMTEDKLNKTLQNKEIIFARTAPEQKLRVVSALKEMGEVVAVTGDGVNDAPALKKADIGVAMGGSGTDVAKEASNIILLDDNFATIVAAVEEGRAVFDNIKKFITYILTSNIPEILPFLAFVVFSIPLPMTVIQILSIDLITDILPAIGLGNEPPENDVMNRHPRKSSDKLVTWKMFLRSYAFIGPLEALFSFILFFMILHGGGWHPGVEPEPVLYMTATGAFLVAIIFSQIGNVFAMRTQRESALRKFAVRNNWIFLGILFELAFAVAIINIPYLHGFFSTGALPLRIWGLMLIFPAVLLFVEELRKLLVRRGAAFLEL